MYVHLQNGFKMVGVILKTITLDAIGMEVTVVTILIQNGKNIVKFRIFVNVWTQILVLQLHHHLLQHLYHQHQHQGGQCCGGSRQSINTMMAYINELILPQYFFDTNYFQLLLGLRSFQKSGFSKSISLIFPCM